MRSACLVIVAVLFSLFVTAGCGGTLSDALGVSTPPIISAVSPNPVTRGSALTINGTNLNGVNTTAYFRGATSAQAVAISGSTTSVVVTVPTGLSAGPYTVDVITNDGTGNISGASNSLTLTVN